MSSILLIKFLRNNFIIFPILYIDNHISSIYVKYFCLTFFIFLIALCSIIYYDIKHAYREENRINSRILQIM